MHASRELTQTLRYFAGSCFRMNPAPARRHPAARHTKSPPGLGRRGAGCLSWVDNADGEDRPLGPRSTADGVAASDGHKKPPVWAGGGGGRLGSTIEGGRDEESASVRAACRTAWSRRKRRGARRSPRSAAAALDCAPPARAEPVIMSRPIVAATVPFPCLNGTRSNPKRSALRCGSGAAGSSIENGTVSGRTISERPTCERRAGRQPAAPRSLIAFGAE
jgi:hypothetical protein